MTTSQVWFGGDLSSDDRQRRFVQTVASAALTWGFDDVVTDHTSARSAYDDGSGRLVEVLIPGLTTSRRILRVLYEPEPDPMSCPVLQSEWTADAYEFDRPDFEAPDEETELWVTGVNASPEQCGRWAADWFERQLRRPVVRREWDRPSSGLSTLVPWPSSGPAYAVWTIRQPDRYLDSKGLTWGWLDRRPASREVVERAGLAAA